MAYITYDYHVYFLLFVIISYRVGVKHIVIRKQEHTTHTGTVFLPSLEVKKWLFTLPVRASPLIKRIYCSDSYE